MAVLGQGLVLMLAGMGIVYLFLTLLIYVSKGACAFVSKFEYMIPEDSPKKKPAVKAGNDDENVALAIAVALG